MFGMIQKENKSLSNLRNNYAKLFSSEIGKEVLKDLENFCGQNRSSVCEESPNTSQTMFAEGKRRVYLRIVNFIEQEKVEREKELLKQKGKNGNK